MVFDIKMALKMGHFLLFLMAFGIKIAPKRGSFLAIFDGI